MVFVKTHDFHLRSKRPRSLASGRPVLRRVATSGRAWPLSRTGQRSSLGPTRHNTTSSPGRITRIPCSAKSRHVSSSARSSRQAKVCGLTSITKSGEARNFPSGVRIGSQRKRCLRRSRAIQSRCFTPTLASRPSNSSFSVFASPNSTWSGRRRLCKHHRNASQICND